MEIIYWEENYILNRFENREKYKEKDYMLIRV